MLGRHGYGVLLLDMRGYEESEGSPNVFGWGAPRTSTLPSGGCEPARRARRAHRRDRLLGRRREDARSSRRNPGLRAVDLRRRRRAIHPRGGSSAGRAVGSPSRRPRVETSRTQRPQRHCHRPVPRGLVRRIAPRPLFLIYAGRGSAGEELNPEYYRAAKEPKTIWKIPEPATWAGSSAPSRVRAARDRLLRDAPSRARRDECGLRKLGRSLLASARRRRSLCAVERPRVRGCGGALGGGHAATSITRRSRCACQRGGL